MFDFHSLAHTDRRDFYIRWVHYWMMQNLLGMIGYADAMRDIKGSESLEIEQGGDFEVPCPQDFLTAVQLGMTFGEFLEFDSPRSWLDRQREGGAA